MENSGRILKQWEQSIRHTYVIKGGMGLSANGPNDTEQTILIENVINKEVIEVKAVRGQDGTVTF